MQVVQNTIYLTLGNQRLSPTYDHRKKPSEIVDGVSNRTLETEQVIYHLSKFDSAQNQDRRLACAKKSQ